MSTGAFWYSLQQNTFRYGGPVLMAVGSVSCILNLMVFTKDTLRKNPCTMCLIVVNAVNLVYFYLGLLFTVLASGYDIDPSMKNIIFCRFRFYIATVLPCWEFSCLILASIDRTLVTSPNAATRKRSTRRLVIISMIGICSFWGLFHIHAWIFTQILQYGPDYFVCYFQPGAYSTFVRYYSLTFNGVIPPVLMGIFGCWTVKNVRQIGRVTRHSAATHTGMVAVGRPYVVRSKDQQLIRMLLVDIVAYVVCKSPLTLLYIYQQITQYREKDVEQQIIEQSIVFLTFFVFFIDNGVGCYTNILVSKTFRTELKNIFFNNRFLCFRQPN